jgi:hypothetical protein
MRKTSLKERQVPSACTVQEASKYAHSLVSLRSRGSGDKANAIDRVARECRVSRGAVWSLLYRPPKRVWADVLQSLRDGYVAACEARLEELKHEITITKALAGPDHPSVRAAEALLRQAMGEGVGPAE